MDSELQKVTVEQCERINEHWNLYPTVDGDSLTLVFQYE